MSASYLCSKQSNLSILDNKKYQIILALCQVCLWNPEKKQLIHIFKTLSGIESKNRQFKHNFFLKKNENYKYEYYN